LAEFVIVEDVDRSSFHPAPEIDCAMVKVEPFPARFRIPSKAYFRRTLDYLFFRRAVSLRDALLSLRRCNLPGNVEAVVEECGDLAGRRVGRLGPEEFGLLALSLHENGVRIPGVSNTLKRRAQNPWRRGRRRGRSGRSKR
jgi:16S rRNA A1518/A1519 N6-dimethyltransferase RsmA/KsgA/DIM1 with predicted DNA glycosylase/AP lyase activity